MHTPGYVSNKEIALCVVYAHAMLIQPSIVLLPDAKRASLVAAMVRPLADAIVLGDAAKQAHWMINGQNFGEVHELFDSIATFLRSAADTLAERARILGATVQGTAESSAKLSALPVWPEAAIDSGELLFAMAVRLAVFRSSVNVARRAVESVGEQDTFDDLVQISKGASKLGWFVLAHLPDEAKARAMNEAEAVVKVITSA